QLRKNGVFADLRNRPFETESDQSDQLFQVFSHGKESSLFVVANFGSQTRKIVLPQEDQQFEIILSSSERKWGGPESFLKISKAGDFKSMPASLNIFKFHSQNN
ncbi:MAG TPA: hypothetical protein VFM60_02315, partial [Salinimicrobium sp.]|nr:hypothetical protein [Salinimicrobium sp.]